MGVDFHANKSESTFVENSTYSADTIAINTRELEAKGVTANAEHINITVTGKATVESLADTAECSSSSASFSTSGTASVSHHEGSVKQVKEQTVFNARQSLTFTADEMHNTGAALTCDTPGGLTVTANSVTNANTDEHRKERGISLAVSRNPNESERTDDPKVPVGSAITSVSQIGYLRKEEHSAVLPTAVNADTATLNLPGMEAVNTDAEQTRKQISSSKTHVKIVLPTVNLAQAKETVSKIPSLFSREGSTPTIPERPRSKGKEEEVEEELPSVNEQEDWVFLSQQDSESSSSTSSSSVHDIRRYVERNARNKGKEEEVEAVEIKDSSVAVFADEFGNQASGLANRMADGLAGMVIEGGLALRDACMITKDAINGECTAEMKSQTFADGVERETVFGVLDQDIAIDTLRGALAVATGGASIAGESMYHAGVAIGKGDAESTQDALAGAALGLVVTRGVLKAKGVPKSSSSKSVTNRSTVQKSGQPKVKPKMSRSKRSVASKTRASERAERGKLEAPKNKIKTRGEAIPQLTDVGLNEPVKLKPFMKARINKWANKRNKYLKKWREKDLSNVPAETRKLVKGKVDNSVMRNMNPDDFAGYAKEMEGAVIPKKEGGFFSHKKEVKQARQSMIKRRESIELRLGKLADTPANAVERSILSEKLSDLGSLLNYAGELVKIIEPK